MFAVTRKEKTAPTNADIRKKRQAEQLRANLLKRKAQMRSRRSGGADDRRDGLPAASAANDSGKD